MDLAAYHRFRQGAVSSVRPMPRNDPTDTGGLFIGRRPGTAPAALSRGARAWSAGRRADTLLAALVLALEALVCLTLWGPQPVAWLWVGSQVDYHGGSITLALLSTFAGMIATLMITLGIATRLDRAWRICGARPGTTSRRACCRGSSR